MKNKKVLFIIDENNEGYKKAIQEMYGNKDKEVEMYNNNYINTHLPDIYDKSQYICTDNNIILEGFSDSGYIYYLYFEPNKAYKVFERYHNKNIYYIKVFGFNIYLLKDDIKQLKIVNDILSLNDIIIPNYIKKISISNIIEYYEKYGYDLDGSRNKTFYSFIDGTIHTNNLYNNTFCENMDYFDDYSLELFINKFKADSSYKYKLKENNRKNFIYLIPRLNISFKINNIVYYLEKGKKYQFLDKKYIFVCFPCFDINDNDKYAINNNFIVYRDFILNNSDIIENEESDISMVNYIKESVAYIYYANEMIDNILDDEIYAFRIINNKLELVESQYYKNSDILLYGRVIKEFMEQYPKEL